MRKTIKKTTQDGDRMCLRTTSTIVRTRVHRRRTPTWQIALRTKGRGRHFIPDKSIVVGNPFTNEACSGTDRSIRCTHRSFDETTILLRSAAVPHSFVLFYYIGCSAAFLPASFLLYYIRCSAAFLPASFLLYYTRCSAAFLPASFLLYYTRCSAAFLLLLSHILVLLFMTDNLDLHQHNTAT